MVNTPPNISSDPRVHVTLKQLIGLEGAARGLSFLPRQPSRSVLNGKHASRIRGRGLNFEELREYIPGDDVRTIDWKVTARTGNPHVRVYTEEKDRPAILVVDQRMSMFFGSRLNMKSVTAAEAGALAAWRILASGDRVGGIVFDDREMIEVRPQRSRRAVHSFLSRVVGKNQALHADLPTVAFPMAMNQPLQAAARLAGHDHLILVISDFDEIDDQTHRLVSRISSHNDVVLILVHDPLAQEFQLDTQIAVSDGRLQLELDRRNVEAIRKFSESRLAQILNWQTELGLSVLPLSAGEPTAPQMSRLLSGRVRRGR